MKLTKSHPYWFIFSAVLFFINSHNFFLAEAVNIMPYVYVHHLTTTFFAIIAIWLAAYWLTEDTNLLVDAAYEELLTYSSIEHKVTLSNALRNIKSVHRSFEDFTGSGKAIQLPEEQKASFIALQHLLMQEQEKRKDVESFLKVNIKACRINQNFKHFLAPHEQIKNDADFYIIIFKLLSQECVAEWYELYERITKSSLMGEYINRSKKIAAHPQAVN